MVAPSTVTPQALQNTRMLPIEDSPPARDPTYLAARDPAAFTQYLTTCT